MKNKKMRLTKIFLTFFGIIALLMIVLIGAFSLYLYREDIMDRYEDIAATAVNISAASINGDDVKESIENGELNPGLTESLELMNKIKDNSNIAYMYMLYYPDKDNPESLKYVLYANTDHDRGNGIPDSVVNADAGDEYTDQMWDAFYKMQFGKEKETRYMVNLYKNIDATALVITAFRPILDADGNTVCIIGADIFASAVTAHIKSYLFWLVILGVIALILGSVGFTMLSRKYIIVPIAGLAQSASNFVEQTRTAESPSDISYDVIEVKQDTEIRDLSEELSHMMGATKAYMIDLKTVTAEKERIGAELSVATQIQADMLPRTFPAYPTRKEFSIYASMDPAKEVGGDFYDFFFTDENHFAMVMADVSGKGVPAALFMVIAKALIKNNAQQLGANASPAKILYEVNNQLCEGNDAELFVTVWLAIIEISTGKGLAANAGHEHPAIRRAGGDYELVMYRHSPAVAVMEGMKFKEHEFQMNPGDSLYIYTDGVAEATDAQNNMYGTERMINVLNQNPDADGETQLRMIREDVDSFVQDAPQFDDLTMLHFKYYGPAGDSGEGAEE